MGAGKRVVLRPAIKALRTEHGYRVPVQGYLAQKQTPTPLRGAVSFERGTPVP